MKKLRIVLIVVAAVIAIVFTVIIFKQDLKLELIPSKSDLVYTELATSWDEGIPLGNATIGALVWKKDSCLRFSLDRTDLWDLRPMDSISGDNNKFSWVKEQVEKNNYLAVQKKYDYPYDALPAPSKIPGAALEFSLEKIGSPVHVQLYVNNALCEAKWSNGTTLKTFVHASEPIGWFVFENLQDSLNISLVSPEYNKNEGSEDSGPVTGLDLRRLGYEQGKIEHETNHITYHQKGWGDFFYDVSVKWKQDGSTLYGSWSVTSSLVKEEANRLVDNAMKKRIYEEYKLHMQYWNKYWAQSSIQLPDSILQKQYDSEMYKLGSASREDSYPISLQAVWTADNGKLPPWKGDYHHDLNTQLSYWPCYTGNHLSEGLGYLNTLWNQRDVYKKYTKQYFEVEGLNIPGVCTLQGVPMGGWIQYSMSPTVSAWLSHHFYLHWKYSGDRTFLEERAYPFIKDVAVFLEQISSVNTSGNRVLPLSSSPESYDNSIKAWFKNMTNFDLALMQFTFKAAAELASELELHEEQAHWMKLKDQLPTFDLDEDNALTIAQGHPYDASHRHLSHILGIHPLGILDWSDGEKAQKIIKASLDKVEKFGADYWTGYTYSWFGIMKARTMDGDGAAKYLRDFANHFCLKNTFHANGDQTNSGKSKFRYRPFTLEGNFAFGSGIQEMLLQSHTPNIRIFPAIPTEWTDVSFKDLRAVGAFLISAEMKAGKIVKVRIYSEQGNALHLISPFEENKILVDGKEVNVTNPQKILSMPTTKGQWIEIKAIELN